MQANRLPRAIKRAGAVVRNTLQHGLRLWRGRRQQQQQR